jgi:hemerythrin
MVNFSNTSQGSAIMKIDHQLFRIGIPVIDNQHEAYLNLLDDLFALGRDEIINRTKIEEALNRAFVYAMEHFDSEEMLMESIKYPALDIHRKKHNEFREGVERLMVEGKFLGAASFLQEVNRWMLKWVQDQIQTHDRALAEYMRKHPTHS